MMLPKEVEISICNLTNYRVFKNFCLFLMTGCSFIVLSLNQRPRGDKLYKCYIIDQMLQVF